MSVAGSDYPEQWDQPEALQAQGDHYVEHAVAKHGEVLRSDLPFPLEIATEALFDL